MHAPYGWLGAGVRGRAWARVLLLMQPVVHHSPLLRRPPTQPPRKWELGVGTRWSREGTPWRPQPGSRASEVQDGERAGEVKTRAPLSLRGAGVAVVPSSPSCSGLKGLGRRGGIEGSGSPNVRLHVREAPPQTPFSQPATRALRKG